MTQEIRNQEFEGERPLYHRHDLRLDTVTIHTGESSLKECRNIECDQCTFEGKYPLWLCENVKVTNCHFAPGGRAAIWYTKNMEMTDTTVEAPKMFRDMDGLKLKNVRLLHAAETLWHCKNVELDGVEVNEGDYIFMHCDNVRISNMTLNGNYSFQYCHNVEIHNSVLNTKDAFWNSENVTVYDSVITGEYLAWHSNRVKLVRCKLAETQPLCYADNLVLEDCEMAADADLAFEYSQVDATIRGHVTSIKNPRTGVIRCESVGEVILDENIKGPADCRIETSGK